MIIKFNPSNKPSYVIQDFLLDDKQTQQQVIGYIVTIKKIGDVRISANDYIIEENGEPLKVITSSEYNSIAILKRKVVQDVGIQLLEDLIQSLQDLAVTDAVKLDILKTVDVVLIMVVGNKIQAARTICAAIPTTANFTTARKNALLAMIDNAVSLL